MSDNKIITLLIVCTISGIVLGMSITRLVMTPRSELHLESVQTITDCEIVISAKVKLVDKPSN